jgi:hypothetical protein
MIKAIIDILNKSSHVTNAVGLNSEGNKAKVYPVVTPQSESAPFVNVRESGRDAIQCKGSATTEYNYSISVVCYAESYEEVNNIADAVQLSLDNQKGTFGGQNVKSMKYQSRQDSFDQAAQLYVKDITITGQCG